MSTIWSTNDWSLATFLAYATDSLPTATQVNRKSVFHFREQDRHTGYSFDELRTLYYSQEGAAVGNVRDLLGVGRDIRKIALAAKEE